MKRILLTCTDLMMIQFMVPHVRYLSENGYHVEVACSEVGGRMDEVRSALEGYAKAIHVVRLVRSPASATNRKGYRDMKALLAANTYDIIWTNEPVMGVVTRLAARKARKQGTKVVYMCHGFHFYKGADIPSWLIFYPIERIMAHFCDAIITMNREDHGRAKKFSYSRVYRIPGVGVDTAKFTHSDDAGMTAAKRRELGLPEDAWVMLTVGELTKRKNQKVLLQAMAALEDPSVHCVLCGKGDQREALEELAQELGISERVHFLGYRMDVAEIYRMADCFVFSTIQEGLPFALMEAMQSGLPIVASRIRGNVDLIDDGVGGILCDAHSSGQFCSAFQKIRTMDADKMAENNRRILTQFDLCNTKEIISGIFAEILGEHG